MNAFFDMGGYGAFVWSAYGAAALVLTVLFVSSWRRQKRLAAQAERLKAAAPRRRRSRPSEPATEGAAS